MFSFPAQKGHRVVSEASRCMGRFALSVAMMTQRSTVGSFLNSGIGVVTCRDARASLTSPEYSWAEKRNDTLYTEE